MMMPLHEQPDRPPDARSTSARRRRAWPQTQNELSTGKRINQPEDDPFGAGRALFLRNELADVQQYQRNINEALGLARRRADIGARQRHGHACSALRELVVQAAQRHAGPERRSNAIAAEIVAAQGVAARAGERDVRRPLHLLAARPRPTPPYPAPAQHLRGQRPARAAPDRPGPDRSTVNQDAAARRASGAERRHERVRRCSTRSRTDLTAGNTRGPRQRRPDGARRRMLDQLSRRPRQRSARARTASRRSSPQLKDMELNVRTCCRKTEDADMAKTMVDFSMTQPIYQSALQAGAQGHPAVAAGLPAVSERTTAAPWRTIESTRFGTIEIPTTRSLDVPGRA